MKAIFEHWTVTLLGCLLVDKTWKSNLLSWAVSKFTVEKGEGWKDKPHSPTSLKFLPVFLRNEMEAGGEMTHTQREDPMTVFLFLLLCLPAPYFRGLFSGITLLCRSRSRENIRASPGLSAKLWSHREQIPLPCSAPLTHTHKGTTGLQMIAQNYASLPLRQAPVFLRIFVGVTWLSNYALR